MGGLAEGKLTGRQKARSSWMTRGSRLYCAEFLDSQYTRCVCPMKEVSALRRNVLHGPPLSCVELLSK